MKIRNGFVSNSSSSSFIIHENIVRVSKKMLNLVIEEWTEDASSGSDNSKKEYKKWQRNLNKALKNPQVKNGIVGITFPSCNYDTFIKESNGNECWISTCNNHHWEDIYFSSSLQYIDEDVMDETIKKYNYWNLRNNIIHSFPDFRDEAMIYVNDVEYICEGCKKPLCSIVTKENGQILCAECYTELNIAKTIKESKFPTSISQLEL